jgi:protein tyrosine phosphatase (PTP) superfamily phosphohydrolase (DUF442 family)
MPVITRARLSGLGVFCYVWLMLGFFSGTLLLIGPVRWITAYLRTGGFTQRTEDVVMIGVIAAFVAGSALLAWLAVKVMGRCRARAARLAIPGLLTMAALVCLYAWSNPAVMASAAGGIHGEVTVGGGAQFVFGPYPDRTRLEGLKREGFTAVVSLQHPAVLPFEPPGIAEEIRVAREIGLPFIHAPMLPWISENGEALERIRRLAHEGRGRYYVHCGLGRDRANVVKRMLEQEGAAVTAGEGFKAATTFAARLEEGNAPMERGLLQQLEPDVFLVPFPNKHEMFGNMLSGQVAHVLLLLDPSVAEQRGWIDEARQRFGEFKVSYSLDTLHGGDADQARALARKAESLPRPLVIVVPVMPPMPHADAARTLISAWRDRSTM